MADIVTSAAFLGRVVVGGYFAYAGWNHFRNHKMLVGYAASKKIPAPTLATWGTGVLLAIGGLSVALGVYPLVGLALLAVFLIGVTPTMHDFWNIEDPMARSGEQLVFFKNIALLGALLALAAIPEPWALSLETLMGTQ